MIEPDPAIELCLRRRKAREKEAPKKRPDGSGVSARPQPSLRAKILEQFERAPAWTLTELLEVMPGVTKSHLCRELVRMSVDRDAIYRLGRGLYHRL